MTRMSSAQLPCGDTRPLRSSGCPPGVPMPRTMGTEGGQPGYAGLDANIRPRRTKPRTREPGQTAAPAASRARKRPIELPMSDRAPRSDSKNPYGTQPSVAPRMRTTMSHPSGYGSTIHNLFQGRGATISDDHPVDIDEEREVHVQDGAHPGRRRSSPGCKRVVNDGDDDEARSCDAPGGRKPGRHGATDRHERPRCYEHDAREQTGLVREVPEVVGGVAVSHGMRPTNVSIRAHTANIATWMRVSPTTSVAGRSATEEDTETSVGRL